LLNKILSSLDELNKAPFQLSSSQHKLSERFNKAQYCSSHRSAWQITRQ